MTAPAHPIPVRPDPSRSTVCQPCSEACAAFHAIGRDRWSDHGLCLNPLSSISGYPVLIGRDCALYRVRGATDFTRGD